MKMFADRCLKSKILVSLRLFRHKLIFSFLLCEKIMNAKGEINETELRYLLTGPSGEMKIPENPTKWIADNSWPEVLYIIFFKEL